PATSFYHDSIQPTVRTSTQATDNKLKLQSDSSSFKLDQAKESVSARRRADTLKNIDVVMKKSESELSEVVVTGYGKQRRTVNAPLARNAMTIDTLAPLKGWAYFDDYVARNIKTPEQLNIKPVRGEVELTFEVDKAGEPVNITVTKSLCEKCDEEAIRLLKEGPTWKKKAKNGKVKIKF
ncbi:MAG TPA: energy transducer TonB, partial [Flavisolibacter sp.]|nr:energy transducer TonB [Flavisolibacter sp.]